MVEEPEVIVQAVAPARTFWEKVMLLHEESFRDDAMSLKGRMSRHLYDVVQIAEGGFAELALADTDLFDRVAEHRRVFFARSRAAHSTLRRGRLRLMPQGERVAEWREDYRRMRTAMFWREPPTFDALLAALSALEARLNDGY